MGYVLLMNIWSVGQGVGSSPTGGASIAPIWVFFILKKLG